MIEKLKIFKNKLFILMIVSFIVTYLGGQDAITSTILYNKLELTNPIEFRIEDKYNKKDNGQNFPDLNFRGKIVGTDNEKEIKVSKGDFDKHEIGQIIKIYKTKSDEYTTEYEIDNQRIIHIGKIGFSFVFIPTIIFFALGFFCLRVILKKKKNEMLTKYILQGRVRWYANCGFSFSSSVSFGQERSPKSAPTTCTNR